MDRANASQPHPQPICFGCGPDNAHGLRATFTVAGDEVHGVMLVTEAMTGAPGRLHGGVMMAFLDEGMGIVTTLDGGDTMTARLTVDLRAPGVVGATLTQRAWVERREGRKWFVRAEVHVGERLLAEAHGLWITPHLSNSA